MRRFEALSMSPVFRAMLLSSRERSIRCPFSGAHPWQDHFDIAVDPPALWAEQRERRKTIKVLSRWRPELVIRHLRRGSGSRIRKILNMKMHPLADENRGNFMVIEARTAGFKQDL